jgi:hypothetical protein
LAGTYEEVTKGATGSGTDQTVTDPPPPTDYEDADDDVAPSEAFLEKADDVPAGQEESDEEGKALLPPRLLRFVEAYYTSLHLSREDVINDCGGADNFVIDGDSMLIQVMQDEALDWTHGGQFLHLTYLVEKFLQVGIAIASTSSNLVPSGIARKRRQLLYRFF